MKNAVKDFVLPTLVLTIICLVVSLALAGTYNATKPIMDANDAKAADAARKEVYAAASGFTKLDVEMIEGVTEVYETAEKDGYVITTASKGFGGKTSLKIMTAIDLNGQIVGVKLVENAETPGLGTKVGLPDYTGRFIGLSKADGVDTIGGATISSNGFKNGVGLALEMFSQIKGGK